ncbi:WhiB family transcriptional regulator [Pseudonocardia sp. KRD-184]|uniref:WhiB family transcriptional regulator n=1 Tax=Pseudonocardia oceani TaxID=2792013 RepID=A0ABS6U7J2_9PSEU|nr:WhiB family transcriptional regulator [Pseudonocardia oceani]MBW0088983.1 WhiB family transcriptional regulator [Pseudonocardia oceani]MBW0095712.1 WhiB family transcriptional regulator [Pseudonocardia oceani]MBW0108543.1 WhiB family transcriptional regulator [Pseudonocardia oceani]MBW0121906.1 WhiB family transcriptional regulator [Pseudonocardia oceani]MBW0128208.1 WhiB family transcriptional regulator [Pseudonocardia oceani]
MTAPTTAASSWRRLAACTVVGPETFYPLDLTPTGPAVIAARRVCATCPVRRACLADVMAAESPARRWGITAGLTPDERTALFAGQHSLVDPTGAVAA